MMKPDLARWRLVAQVLPLVFATVAAKLVFNALDWESILVNPLLTGLVAADVFVLGFLLAGTLSDYKESERLPGDLAAGLETLADECQILYLDKRAPEAGAALDHIRSLASLVHDWLHGRAEVGAVLDSLRELNPHLLAFEPLTQPNFIVRLKQEQATIRRMVIRIDTIRVTSFVGAGYALAELASLALVAGLLFVEIVPLGAALFVVGLITFLLAYMIALIKDLDDPFEYANGARGAAEVSLRPLYEVERRLDALAHRTGAAGGEAESPAPVPTGGGRHADRDATRRRDAD